MEILKAVEGRPVDKETSLPGLPLKVVEQGISYLTTLGVLGVEKDARGKHIYRISKKGKTFIEEYKHFDQASV